MQYTALLLSSRAKKGRVKVKMSAQLKSVLTTRPWVIENIIRLGPVDQYQRRKKPIYTVEERAAFESRFQPKNEGAAALKGGKTLLAVVAIDFPHQ